VTVGRVVIVPGLGVRTYAEDAAGRLRRDGHRVSLLRAPSWRGAPTDLEAYGRLLAEDLARRDERVDLLVGLSVGTQAAAAAALASSRVHGLLLVSPTVDPRLRSLPRLLRAWWSGNEGHGEPGFAEQVPDWARAGVPRLAAGFVGTLRAVPLEQVLPHVEAQVTVVHAQHDDLGSESWAQQLATGAGGRFVRRADAPHSWPVGDADGFAALVGELLDGRNP
jgi:hypothetical protein